jgi:exodeoxyribonuclease V alpha subunit
MTASVESLRKAKLLGPLDEHCARTLCRIAGETRPEVLLATAIAVRQVGLGHVCTDLPALTATARLAGEDGVTLHEVVWPELARWLAALRESALVGAPLDGQARRPLVLDAAGRLYLRRYHEHEQRLAAAIVARAASVEHGRDGADLEAVLSRLFAPRTDAPGSGTTQPVATDAAQPVRAARATRRPAPGQLDLGLNTTRPAVAPPAAAEDPERDEQRDAARTAATRRLCVISGGPGTGKTSTVVKILALLAELRMRVGSRPPRVLLLAPTGKAAMRLTEAIRRAKSGLACDEAVRAAIPEEASTIHRALGSVGGSGTRFRHHREHRLRADVVLVDEASMVDLALMSRLVDAVPDDARLILLGDKDQLASVEAGAVLGELCGTATGRASRDDAATPLAASIVELTRSYRYRPGSGIEALANAVNAGEAARALEILADDRFADVARRDPAPAVALSDELRADALAGGRIYLASTDARARLLALEGFRVLCAHRQGPHGVTSANAEIEALLAGERLIDRRVGPTYAGRPIMITRNDYQLHLFNGDVGTIVARDGKHLAFFVAPDGEERVFSPARLPPHETVFAMTVHKSQGSEFDRVAVLLGDRSSPLLTRELLYTAVTRAREAVTLYATRAVLEEAIARRTERGSGLRDALWGPR